MGSYSDDLRNELEKEYCPPVDSALFAAITTDFDLTNPDEVNTLRETLDSIRDLAIQQEDLPFDPSGTANDPLDDADMSAARPSSAGQDNLQPHTDNTGSESYGLDRSDTRSSKSQTTSHSTYTIAADGSLQFVGGSDKEKVNLLVHMFPDISAFNIEQSLKKSNGDIEKSMDILLNLSFFEATADEDQVAIPKGVEGFMEEIPDIGRHKGRKKKRNKNNKVTFDQRLPSDDPPATNKWEKGQADVEFICSRTPDLPRHKVASAYTANNRSLPGTIKALATAHLTEDNDEPAMEPVIQSQLDELVGDYPNVSENTLVGLLRITRNMMSAASELVAEMVRQPSDISVSDLIKITAPKLNLDDEANVVDSRSRQKKENLRGMLDYEDEQAVANAYFAAKTTANMQAAQAARKAKSDPLYGGASQYYREVAQQQRELAMRHLCVASERLVDRQSTNGDVDLHGCQVPQAIRIARERVEAWWDGLGDTKHVRGGGKQVHGGFKIITGVGLHSRDGKSRLGPAVSKALISDGWRVEIGRGFVTVVGVARR
ncbi:hypothetical protein PMG11_05332 [Penicillium brasilianum]|uniref:Smr domain protein n=1 Tax=Penicillium brasilianum TaxID=104259 RepID=A0A0F7VF82_PENBI|nr:hypothetical protein PMG11_05332 [Penicillium brasilianum]